MSLTDIFKSPFKLTGSHMFSEPVPKIKVSLKTKNMCDKTSKEEVFILCKMYFDNYVSKYKNYRIEGMQTTESTYRLSVGVLENDELKYKHIYSIAYNNIADRISWENKYDDNFDIEGNFFIALDISAYVISDYDSEDEEEYKFKQTIPQPECIVCYENSPSILYTNCMHYAVCHTCDKKGNFSKCPLCRKKIKSGRILFS